MTILKTYGRVWSDDMDSALAVLVELVEEPAHLRFAFGEVEIAAIGDFLVIAGSPEATARLPRASTTVVVSDLTAVEALLTARGATLTHGPERSLTGSYLYARHADGAEVEYVQWKPELITRILGRAGRPGSD
ncbi:VOC family protein [Kitasatospora sp. NPDC059747]|uniref:VOC family protein n=1 Tax=Kitasatospora sp. NPDC059747 TaxID=3346930 RepID=UPI0036606D56